MRKIESQMNQAISASKDWRSANTEVSNENGVSIVKLHGNKIAEVGDDFITLYDGGWQSTTTKSRLNAILRVHGTGEGVYQKNRVWYLSTAEGDVEFESGVVLA
jgi:hypothetical protein